MPTRKIDRLQRPYFTFVEDLDVFHNDDRCRVRNDNAIFVLGMTLQHFVFSNSAYKFVLLIGSGGQKGAERRLQLGLG
jgi:hypothetical protein